MARYARGVGRPSLIAPSWIVAGLLVSSTLGCGPKVDLMRQAPGFDYRALSAGGLCVLGLVSTEHGDEPSTTETDQLTTFLETSLRKERADLKLVPVGRLQTDLGMDLYDQTLLDFGHAGKLNRDALAHLDSLAGDQVRYLLLGRIEDKSISHSESSSQDEDSGEETVTLKTSLYMRVAFEIYDLQSQQAVWSATLVQSKDKSADYKEKSGGNLLVSLLGSILGLNGSGEKEYPPPPDETKILGSICSMAAEKLPRSGH